MALLDTLLNYSVNLFREWYAKIIASVIILLIGFIIGRLAGRVVYKILHDLELDRVLKKGARIDIKLERGVSVFITYFIYFITIIMVLNQLNVTTTVLQMLSAAIIIIVIISVILAIKDFIPNVFAGFYLYRNKFVKEGEMIRVRGIEGRVREVTLLETKLETRDGDTVYMPNSVLTKTEIVKLKSMSGKKGRRKKKK